MKKLKTVLLAALLLTAATTIANAGAVYPASVAVDVTPTIQVGTEAYRATVTLNLLQGTGSVDLGSVTPVQGDDATSNFTDGILTVGNVQWSNPMLQTGDMNDSSFNVVLELLPNSGPGVLSFTITEINAAENRCTDQHSVVEKLETGCNNANSKQRQ